MLSLTSTGTELRRFGRGRLPRIAVVAIVLVPLLYGALYLWAFWDPTGNLDKLPVALVNADTGAVRDGEQLNAGDEVVTKLLESDDLDWQVTNAQDAASGVLDGRYYFAVTVPADFSADLVSAGGDDPTAAQLEVTYDDANSFLASTLGRTAMAQVRTAVSQSAGQDAVDTLLVGLGSARDGFAQASDGALTLAAASGQVSDGARQVADGATQAADGSASLATGVGQAADGAARLSSGAATLATGAVSLASGADTLAAGATTAAGGASSVATGSAALATALTGAQSSSATLAAGAATVATSVSTARTTVAGLTANLPALRTGLTSVSAYLSARATAGDATAGALLQGLSGATLPSDSDLATLNASFARLDTGAAAVASGTSSLQTGLSTLAGKAGELATGAGTLATGAQTLATGAASLDNGAHTLSDGAGDLADGASDLADGTATLADGATTLAEGTATLAGGATTLADGTGQLTDGTQTLADALTDGAAAIPADDDTTRTQRAATVSAPVALDSDDVAAAEGFGEGFAPFFLSLALFVGSLITWLLLRPMPSRALATPASGWRITLAGYLPALAIGVAQVAVILSVVRLGLGLHMSTVVGTIGFTLLVVATFLALQQALMALLGPAAGKVAVLALLMLQLASSGGTYPVETTPLFFRVLHPLLPMSYAVTGLRHVVTGDPGAAWAPALILLGVLVGSLAVSSWRAGRLRTWSMARLHPALTI